MDFTNIFGGEALTLEQFNEKTKGMKLADLSGGEYIAKGKHESDLQKVQTELKTAKQTISTLETNKGDMDALQKELDKYKAAEEKRLADEEAAAAHAALTERFKAVLGENKFASEFTEQGVFASFEKAINDPANVGKGDAELFAALTKDKEGIFQSAHPSVNMGGVKPIDGGRAFSIQEIKGMTPAEINQNWAAIKQSLNAKGE